MPPKVEKEFKLLEGLKDTPGHPTHEPGVVLRHVSCSQITTYRKCPKLWYMNHVKKVREPSSKAMEFGTDVHSFIEQALRDGEYPEGFSLQVQGVALSGQRFWPETGTPMWLEDEFLFRDPRIPLPVYGFIDVRTPEEAIDHKTTSDINRNGKTAEQWANDPQGVIYPAVNMSLGGKPRFRIIYYQTKGRKSINLQVPTSAQQIDFGLQQIGRDVEDMLRIAQLPFDQVPHNTQACNSPWACFMQPHCARVGVMPDGLGANEEAWKAFFQRPIEPERPANQESVQMSVQDAGDYRSRMAALRAAGQQKAAALPADPEAALPLPPAPKLVTPTPAAPPPPPPPARAVPPAGINPPDGVKAPLATMPELQAVLGTAVAPETPDGDEDVGTLVLTHPPETDAPSAPVADATPAAPARRTKTKAPAAAKVDIIVEPETPLPPRPQSQPPEVSEDAVRDTLDAQNRLEIAVAKSADDVAATERAYKKARLDAMDDDSDAALEAAGKAKHIQKAAVADHEQLLADLSAAKQAHQAALVTERARRAAADAALAAAASAPVVPPAAVAHSPGLQVSTVGRTMYLGCGPEIGVADVVHFDDWVQQYARRVEDARKVPYYRMIPHNAIDAVVSEILADLRSGNVAPPTKLVFRRFSAQYYQYVQDLRPFYDEVVS